MEEGGGSSFGSDEKEDEVVAEYTAKSTGCEIHRKVNSEPEQCSGTSTTAS